MTHQATVLSPSSHQDTFARDHLPPANQWPVFLFDTPEVQYPEQLNATQALVDQHIAQGKGERCMVKTPTGLTAGPTNNCTTR
jgi:2-aminobenzoate-CoA ligase